MVADYTSTPLVKAQLGITTDDDDDLIAAAVSAASRSIDRWTGTTFYGVTEARLFMVSGCGVQVDRFTDITGLIVAAGPYGTYTPIAASNYRLEPLNAVSSGGAYDHITLLAGATGSYVQVTATWGFTEVPADVAAAALIKAAALYRRKDAPEGESGAMEFGTPIGRDEDVAHLLRPYTDPGIA